MPKEAETIHTLRASVEQFQTDLKKVIKAVCLRNAGCDYYLIRDYIQESILAVSVVSNRNRSGRFPS